ncbi:MAG: CpsD/CapB family tyrosine-protein kinase [Rhodospirillales bacterium]
MIPLPIQYEEVEIIYAATAGEGRQAVCVTAAEHGEGVSTVAYALARRTAAAGKSTLFADLNTARPSAARRLGVDPAALDPKDGGIFTSPSTGLSVFCGASAGADSELTSLRDAQNLRARIETWRKSYDALIFDTSPLTRINRANIMADAVAALCDASILVVLAGRTAETRVAEAVNRLAKAGAPLTGTVLNDRHNPSLADEFCRETRRLENRAPDAAARTRAWLRRNAFLNQRV